MSNDSSVTEYSPAPARELTLFEGMTIDGEKAVGITFNPGKHELVNQIKELMAEDIDVLNKAMNESSNPEVKRMYSVAITELQSAQMWAVKAATWQY